MESTSIIYKYYNLLEFTWDGTEATADEFRQEIDWGNENKRNRIGVYLVSDPENTGEVRFFLTARDALPAGPENPVNLTEPIVEEVDANNRSRRLFYIGPGTSIYAEPSVYPAPNPTKLYVYQVAGFPVKYFGL